MPTPEIWGPATWNLFHTLAENIDETAYSQLKNSLFYIITRICKFLPCPECSNDATTFLGKIKIENFINKFQFKNMLYLFHNYVNAKKRKPLFNHTQLSIYSKYKVIPIFNNFIINYNTKGNMKLLTDSFQRQFVIKEVKFWIMANIKAFLPRQFLNPNNGINKSPQPVVEESEPVVEELPPHVCQESEPVVEELPPHVSQESEPLVEESEPLVEESDNIIKQIIFENTNIDTDNDTDINFTVNPVTRKSKKSKKSKK